MKSMLILAALVGLASISRGAEPEAYRNNSEFKEADFDAIRRAEFKEVPAVLPAINEADGPSPDARGAEVFAVGGVSITMETAGFAPDGVAAFLACKSEDALGSGKAEKELPVRISVAGKYYRVDIEGGGVSVPGSKPLQYCRYALLVHSPSATFSGDISLAGSNFAMTPAELRALLMDKSLNTRIPSENQPLRLKLNNGVINRAGRAEGSPVAAAAKGYVVAVDPSAGAPAASVEWVSIPGGRFMMGTDYGFKEYNDALPVHEVAIKTFEMAKTAVTVEQYAECVIKGGCTQPHTGGYCNWDVAGRENHPVNCLDWDQAVQYARFKGARLPSEAEWEYAATGGGRNQKYPWGNEPPTGDLAVINSYGTMPVCSKPAGNTAQGLCDMSGNIQQWVQGVYRESYNGAPADGSAVEGAGALRVVRGGCFATELPMNLRSDRRQALLHDYGIGVYFGFRIAR